MSYRCQNCGEQQSPNNSPKKVVSKKRNTFYPEKRNRDNEVVARQAFGWEIVEEKDCCEKCAPKVEENCRTVK